MDIICARCGMVNKSTAPGQPCGACNSLLHTPLTDPLEGKTLGLDMKRLSTSEVTHSTLEGRKGLGRLLRFPAVYVATALRRRQKAPWAHPMFRGRVARFHKIDLSKYPGPPITNLKVMTSELRGLGFIPIMDRLFESTEPPSAQRLFVNKEKRLFAVATFQKTDAEPKIKVMAIQSEDKGTVSVSNTRRGFVSDPKTKEYHFPGAGVKKLVAAVEKQAPVKKRQDARFDMKTFLGELAESHERMVDDAMKRGLLIKVRESAHMPRKAEIGAVPECSIHPRVTAIRRCGVCGKPICGACHFYYEGYDYCAECLPEEAGDGKASPLDLMGDLRPAGFAIRGAIRLFEVVALFSVIVWLFPERSSAGSKIAYQAIAVAGFISYFYFPVLMWGGTPLQRALGLSVIDYYGEPLAHTAVLARTGYILLTLMAAIPVLGYLAALWDPYRRGWHDRMAGTMVVTSNEKVKEKAGFAALLIMVWLAVYNAQGIKDASINVFTTAFGGLGYAGALSADAVWERPTDDQPAIRSANSAIAVIGGHVVSVDLYTGAPLWKAPVVGVKWMADDPYSGAVYVYALENGKKRIPFLAAVKKEDGAVLWKTGLDKEILFPPVSHSGGVSVILGRDIVTFNRLGGEIWRNSPKEGAPVEIFAARGTVVVYLRKSNGDATLALDARRGSRKSFLPWLTTEIAGRDGRFVLVGEDKTVLYDFEAGKEIWSIGDSLYFPDTQEPAGGVYFSRTEAIAKADGKRAFAYPEGCVYSGAFKQVVAVSCAARQETLFISAALGAKLGVVEGHAFSRIELIGEWSGGYYLAGFRKAQLGRAKTSLITTKRDMSGADIFYAGEMGRYPRIETLQDNKRLFVTADYYFGVYKAPWSR